MDIYSEFVFHDKLVSPITGYSCKIITKQNIMQFGFSSIEEFKLQLPNFPQICKSLAIQRSQGTKNQHSNGHNSKVKENRIKEQQKNYNPKKCPKCNNLIPFDKRFNLYCSRSCANSREFSHETNRKRSESLIKHHQLAENKKIKVKYDVVCSFCKKTHTRNKRPYSKVGLFSCEKEECKLQLKTYISKINGRKGGKRSAAKRCKRSKQEIELYNLLEQHFKNIGNNDPIANGWDADILLYDHKIAILWNGPWHYREMGFSNHSLKQVVNRDCIKIQEFENIEWKVLIYQDNQWTPEEAMIDTLIQTNFNSW